MTTNVQQVAGLVLSGSGIGLAGGDLSSLDRSTDAGQSWQPIQSPTPARLLAFDWEQHLFGRPSYVAEDLDFANPDTGWSVGWTGGLGRIWKYSNTTGIEDPGPVVTRLRLWSHPNPFATTVEVELESPGPGPVAAAVYSLAGRRVALLGGSAAGSSRFLWDGTSDDGREVPAGVYFLRLTGPGIGTHTEKLVLLAGE